MEAPETLRLLLLSWLSYAISLQQDISTDAVNETSNDIYYNFTQPDYNNTESSTESDITDSYFDDISNSTNYVSPEFESYSKILDFERAENVSVNYNPETIFYGPTIQISDFNASAVKYDGRTNCSGVLLPLEKGSKTETSGVINHMTLQNNKSLDHKIESVTYGPFDSKINFADAELSSIDWSVTEEPDDADNNTDANVIPEWFASLHGLDNEGYQMDGFSRQFRAEEDDEDGEIVTGEQKGVSLTFVFDSTGSMWDDLVQVRSGADKILATIVNRPDNPIYNYVLIPFQDPHIGPVTVTRDHKEFRESLQNIQIAGGGDCPEMAVGAVRRALELSLPNSYIFVFTDARSKDYTLVPDVQSLIQRKQSQIVFVLTGYCKDLSHKGYLAYQEIAATSSGQVFHIDKVNVEEILEFVRHSLNSRKVNLLSISKPANSTNEHELLVDESLKEFTVSVSGRKPTINVTDPAGTQLTGPPKLKPLVSLENVSVVNIQEPDPGPWKVKVSSESDHVVRSTGVSNVDFITKFSTIMTDSLDEAAHRPLKGTNNSVIIKPTQPDVIYNLTHLRLLSLDGHPLREVTLHPTIKNPGNFQGGPFFPPYDFFHIEINGFNKDGKPIKRISPTAISAQDPAIAVVTMRPHTTGWVNEPVTLRCHVESLVPFKVMWFKEEDPISGYILYEQTSKVLWHINAPSPNSEGNYTCWTRNVAGISKKNTWLSITGPPPKVETAPQVVSRPSASAALHCTVHSVLEYNVTWARTNTITEQHGSETLEFIDSNSKYSVLDNGTLNINRVKMNDEGWYVCIAQSKGGKNEGQIYLAVREPVRVTLFPDTFEFSKGDSFAIECSATGIPQPRITWKKDKIHIRDLYSLRTIISNSKNGSVLIVENADKSAEGIYHCEAENNVDIDVGLSKARYVEAPSVVVQPKSVLIKAGDEINLNCLTTGIPTPKITWEKSERIIKDNGKFQILKNGTLKITSIETSDSGEYACLAENKIGISKGIATLEVGMAPRIVQLPADIEIPYNGNGSIPCMAIGLPAPTISWIKSDGTAINSSNIKMSESGNLIISDAKIENGGTYICRVENKFSTLDLKARVKIIGLASPVLDAQNPGPKLTLIHGDSAELPCRVLIGEPAPDVSWYKDGELLKKEEIQWPGVVLLDNNALYINYATKEIEGLYSCIATNAVGAAKKTIQLHVLEPPRFYSLDDDDNKPPKSVYTMKAGEDLIIPCSANGNPKPQVTWQKDKMPLISSRTVYKDYVDNSLIIRNASKHDSGTYVCVAQNSAGVGSKAVAVFVQVPPKVHPGKTLVTALEGQPVTLFCEFEAVPAATVDWYKNGEFLSPLLYDIALIGQKSQLRFVANFSDNAKYKCVAENEAGSDSKEITLTVIVPPSVYPPQDEFVKARFNGTASLQCLTSGFPQPRVSWHKNGEHIRNDSNTSLLQENTVLTINRVRLESAGVYVCNVENVGGIIEKSFYVIVQVPPKIWEDLPSYVQLMEGEDYAIPCSADGFPSPKISWKKEGKAIMRSNFDDVTVHADGTLLITTASTNTTGMYSCVAENVAGTDEKHYIVEIMVSPSMMEMDTTKLEVVEGDPVALSCPAMNAVPPPKFQWLKDDAPLNFLNERSDIQHFNMKEKDKVLEIAEVRLSDSGSYTCIASNVAGQTDAKFTLDVLTFPHFEEYSHQQLKSVVESSPLRLDCFVSGNPTPKVTWKKNNVPLSLHTAPGIVLLSNGQTLNIPNIKIHDAGNYQCSAQNKVGFIERDFHIYVLVPPNIDGVSTEHLEVVFGEPVLLQCPITGIPDPKIEWTKDGHSMVFNDIKDIILSNDKKILEISSTEKYNEGIYVCMGTNSAGSKTKLFNITVLEPPIIAQEQFLEEIKVREGEGTSLFCRVSGFPQPKVTWLHNGRIIDDRANEVEESPHISQHTRNNEHVLSLKNLGIEGAGKYTCLATSKVGVAEKHFKVKILVAPRLSDHGNTIEAFEGLPVSIKCPVVGNPELDIHWMKDDKPLNEETMMEESEGPMLHISSSKLEHSGNYTCIAENNAGNVSTSFQLDVMAPPTMMEKEESNHIVKTGDTLKLYCNASGHPLPKIVWLKGASEIRGNSWIRAYFEDYDRKLVIPNVSMHHGGKYSCLAINMAGETETTFNVEVQEPPYRDQESQTNTNYSVKIHRRLVLKCPLTGLPQPRITWFKDGVAVSSESDSNIHISSDGQQLHLMQASTSDAGEYSCLAENSAGSEEIFFFVSVEVPMEWSPWSQWSECSTTCGPGIQVRVRTCGEDVEPNLVDTKECPGESQQVQSCHMSVCPIDGGWSEWSNWTSCSESCGRATRRRYRKCNNPVPAYGGQPCSGSDAQQEICHQTPCAIHGEWSEWSAWSQCTESCGEGKRYRTRECNSPAPAYGGNNCEGPNMEVGRCNIHKCPIHGGWSPWGEWTSCSVTCGSGNRRRYRTCTNPPPQLNGSPCLGENLQVETCNYKSCRDVPPGASIRVHGRLNGENIPENIIDTRVIDQGSRRIVTADVDEVLRHKASWFPYLPFILSPVLWNTAKEEDEANNGYSLTNGNFRQNTLLEFVTGEELTLSNTGQGLDEYGTLQVDIEVDGAVPIVQSEASVFIDTLAEEYIQTSPNTLFSSSKSAININGKKLPYSHNNTVHYDSMQGTMPYLVEELLMENFGLQYDPSLDRMKYAISTTIRKKFENNKCPDGFFHDERYLHCRDINECRDKHAINCHHTQACENLFGTYRCYCRPGFKSVGDGTRCLDVNECLQNPSPCSQICKNRKGGFKCLCHPGYYLLPDGKTCAAENPSRINNENEVLHSSEVNQKSRKTLKQRPEPWRSVEESWRCPPGFEDVNGVCQDIDECQRMDTVCSLDQTCLNTKGSYRCLETPCPDGYERDPDTGNCNMYCDDSVNVCEDGTLLMQSVIYTTLTPHTNLVHPYQDLMVLTVHGEDGRQLPRTRFRVVENEIGKPFRVRFEGGQGVLYTLKSIMPDQIHRISVLAASYDEGEKNIVYRTKFIIFILVSES